MYRAIKGREQDLKFAHPFKGTLNQFYSVQDEWVSLTKYMLEVLLSITSSGITVPREVTERGFMFPDAILKGFSTVLS